MLFEWKKYYFLVSFCLWVLSTIVMYEAWLCANEAPNTQILMIWQINIIFFYSFLFIWLIRNLCSDIRNLFLTYLRQSGTHPYLLLWAVFPSILLDFVDVQHIWKNIFTFPIKKMCQSNLHFANDKDGVKYVSFCWFVCSQPISTTPMRSLHLFTNKTKQKRRKTSNIATCAIKYGFWPQAKVSIKIHLQILLTDLTICYFDASLVAAIQLVACVVVCFNEIRVAVLYKSSITGKFLIALF